MKYIIRNNKTGETKTVSPDSLPKFGLSAPAQPAQEKPKQFNKGLLGTLGVNIPGLNDRATQANTIREPNFLGHLLTPRAASNQAKMSRGQNVSLDERLGAAGEVGQMASIPFGPAAWGAGAALHGATNPGASIKQRATNAAIEG